jgi:hypothetical protein
MAGRVLDSMRASGRALAGELRRRAAGWPLGASMTESGEEAGEPPVVHELRDLVVARP